MLDINKPYSLFWWPLLLLEWMEDDEGENEDMLDGVFLPLLELLWMLLLFSLLEADDYDDPLFD